MNTVNDISVVSLLLASSLVVMTLFFFLLAKTWFRERDYCRCGTCGYPASHCGICFRLYFWLSKRSLHSWTPPVYDVECLL